MRYASIRTLDVTNGEGIGVSLFVQGCHFHCKNCFNSETWDFKGGHEWNDEAKEVLFKQLENPYIERISILGGEPLCDENVHEVCKLVKEIRHRFPEKYIWLYTGYTYEDIFDPDDTKEAAERLETVKNCFMLVEGRYIDSQKDMSLKWCGSKNQRVIFMPVSLWFDAPICYD